MIIFTLRIPDHYAECYPGMTEMDDAIDDSDEEADYSKMDLVSFKAEIVLKSSLDSIPSTSHTRSSSLDLNFLFLYERGSKINIGVKYSGK